MNIARSMTLALGLLFCATAGHAQSNYYPAMKSGRDAFTAGQFDAAEAHFQTALREATSPQQKARTWYSLAVVSQRQNKPQDARTRVRAALALTPDDAQAKGLLAELDGAPPSKTPPPTVAKGATVAPAAAAAAAAKQPAPSTEPTAAPKPQRAALGGDMIMTEPHTAGMFGSFPACRVAIPFKFLADERVFRVPIQRADVTKVIAFRRECDRTPNNLPANGNPDAPKTEDRVRIELFLSPTYSARAVSGAKVLRVSFLGLMQNGAYVGLAQLMLAIDRGENRGYFITTAKENESFFKSPLQTAGDTHLWRVYGHNGQMFHTQGDYEKARTPALRLADALALKTEFVSKDGKRIAEEQFTALFRAKGATTDISMKCAIEPLASRAADLTANRYRLTLRVNIELTQNTRVQGMGSNTSVRTISKDVPVEITKANCYKANGVAHVATESMSTSGNALFFKVDIDVVGAKPFVTVTKMEALS